MGDEDVIAWLESLRVVPGGAQMITIDTAALRALIVDAVKQALREERAVAPAAGYLSTREAAEQVGVSESFVRRLAARGLIPAAKAGRVWRVRLEDLEAFMSAPRPAAPVPDYEARARKLLAESSRSRKPRP